MGQHFDQDHEGHWGWRADEILFGRPGEGSLSEWLVNYTPDLALIHIGTNDVDQLQSKESSVTEIKEIIDTLRSDNPNMIIFLAKLIPINSVVLYNPGIIELNGEIDGIAADKSTVDSPVWVVDQYNGFDAAADTYDNFHPNTVGEEKMAQKWYDAMQTYLNPCMDGLDNDGDGFIDFPTDPDCPDPQGKEGPAMPALPAILLLLGS
jgi:hypothetical protein